MYYLLIILVVLLPVPGIFLIEGGEMGGEPIGALYPYLLYLVSFYIAFRLSKNKNQPDNAIEALSVTSVNTKMSKRTIIRIVILLVILMAIALGPFNGLAVLRGEIDKGTYRSQMQYFGFVMAILTKYFVPALFCRLCIEYYKNSLVKNKLGLDKYFYLSVVIVLVIGLTFGSKATGVFILICGLIVLFWRKNIAIAILALGVPAILLIFFSAYLFDSFIEDTSIGGIGSFILFRSFVLTAEAPWKVWDLYIAGSIPFDYPKTLAQFLGGFLISIFFGIGKFDATAYQYDFAKSVTALLYPNQLDVINSGEWNLTPTAYVEGILALGVFGIVLFGIIAGIILGKLKKSISFNITKGRYSKASVLIVYFVFAFVPWINTGGIVILFHPITIFGILLSYYLLELVEKLNFYDKK